MRDCGNPVRAVARVVGAQVLAEMLNEILHGKTALEWIRSGLRDIALSSRSDTKGPCEVCSSCDSGCGVDLTGSGPFRFGRRLTLTCGKSVAFAFVVFPLFRFEAFEKLGEFPSDAVNFVSYFEDHSNCLAYPGHNSRFRMGRLHDGSDSSDLICYRYVVRI